MEYKKLGRADISVSRIGLGCWALGGHGYGRVDEADAVSTVRAALDMGVTLFDTADVYGFGRSEEILSRALGSRIKDVVVATKFGVNWDSEGRTFKDCSPERARQALEASLRRLKLDCIPIYQIHWYDDKSMMDAVMDTLLECQRQGKIRHIGCSNFSWTLVSDTSARGRLESFQCEYNLTQRAHEGDMRRCAENLGMSVWAYRVLGRGLLSGKYDASARFGDNDTRSKDEGFRGERLERSLLAVNTLKAAAAAQKRTPAQLAIRWVLEKPWVSCALVGAKNPEQVAENIAALEGDFSLEGLGFFADGPLDAAVSAQGKYGRVAAASQERS